MLDLNIPTHPTKHSKIQDNVRTRCHKRQSTTNSIRGVQDKTAEWISIGCCFTYKNNRHYPSASVSYQTMMVFNEVSEIQVCEATWYLMHVHSQDMMIVPNLAVSFSFLRRLSDEWWDVLRSTVSSSGNNRQRASPTEGSTSWVIKQHN